MLSFEDWFYLNEDLLIIEFAETGADRESCFDFEFESEKRYELYLKNFEVKNNAYKFENQEVF